jgi:hypothetical protein
VPWAGPLKTAAVYFLFLNPGLSPEDVDYENREPTFVDALRANLSGADPYVYLLERFCSAPGYRWAKQPFGSDIGDVHSDRMCVLQLVPYHSKGGAPARRIAPRLPSSQQIRRFVHQGLMPSVLAGEIGLVVARAWRLWGIAPEERRTNLPSRSPDLGHGRWHDAARSNEAQQIAGDLISCRT